MKRARPEQGASPSASRRRRRDRCLWLFGVPRAVLKAELRRERRRPQRPPQVAVRAVLEGRGLGRVGTSSFMHRDILRDILTRIAQELRAEELDAKKEGGRGGRDENPPLEQNSEELDAKKEGGGGGRDENPPLQQHPEECHQGIPLRDFVPPMRTNPRGDQQPSVCIPTSVLGPCLDTLLSHGIVRIPRVFSARTVHALRDHLRHLIHSKHTISDRETTQVVRLRAASGNGKNGLYFYLNDSTGGHDALKQLKKTLACALYKTSQERAFAIRGTRCIGLGYSNEGVNFMHQDQQKLPYQALVLLSQPGTDFTGGELYVEARQRGEPPEPNYTPLPQHSSRFNVEGSAGDVVVFCANSSECGGRNDQQYFHGMTRVSPGTGDVCERWAIGLFHGGLSNSRVSAPHAISSIDSSGSSCDDGGFGIGASGSRGRSSTRVISSSKLD